MISVTLDDVMGDKRMNPFNEILDPILAKYPICQYALLDVTEIPFSEKVRYICKSQCGRYGKSWSCPPAVGEVEECRKRCFLYEKVLVFTTMAEVTDAAIMEETLKTRKNHEAVTRGLCKELEDLGIQCLPLSGESCQICDTCAYPEKCRHPESMIPCVESYGILVTEIAETCGIEFYTDNRTVTWFGMIALRK